MAVEEDIDVSGFSRGLDRPGLRRILTRLADFEVIVFFKIDRLARSTVDFAEIMKLSEAQGVALASATEPLDLTSSVGRAMAKVIAVFAELESDMIGMRVSSAHEHLRREGRYTGGRVPYGYRVAPNPNGAGKVLEVNAEEAKTVHMIVELADVPQQVGRLRQNLGGLVQPPGVQMADTQVRQGRTLAPFVTNFTKGADCCSVLIDSVTESTLPYRRSEIV